MACHLLASMEFSDVPERKVKMNKIGIDVHTKDAIKLIRRLERLVSTRDVAGPFPYREDKNYAQLHLTTALTEKQVEDWLYSTKHGAEYVGTWVISPHDTEQP